MVCDFSLRLSLLPLQLWRKLHMIYITVFDINYLYFGTHLELQGLLNSAGNSKT